MVFAFLNALFSISIHSENYTTRNVKTIYNLERMYNDGIYTWINRVHGTFRHISDQPGRSCRPLQATPPARAASIACGGNVRAGEIEKGREGRLKPRLHGGSAEAARRLVIMPAIEARALLSRVVRARGGFSPARVDPRCRLPSISRLPPRCAHECGQPTVQGSPSSGGVRAISCGGWPAGRGRTLTSGSNAGRVLHSLHCSRACKAGQVRRCNSA